MSLILWQVCAFIPKSAEKWSSGAEWGWGRRGSCGAGRPKSRRLRATPDIADFQRHAFPASTSLKPPELPSHSTSHTIIPAHELSWTSYAMQLALVRRNYRVVWSLMVLILQSGNPILIRSQPNPDHHLIDSVTYAADATNGLIISIGI